MAKSSLSLGGWLAALRIFTGFFWAQHGYGKLTDAQWALPNGQMAQFLQEMSKGSSGAYHDFVINVVLPNSVVFAHLVAWGETLVGISLLFGLFTKIGGIGGAFLALNYLAARGSIESLGTWTGLEAVAAVLSLACVVLPVSSALALDALIFRGRRR